MSLRAVEIALGKLASAPLYLAARLADAVMAGSSVQVLADCLGLDDSVSSLVHNLEQHLLSSVANHQELVTAKRWEEI